MFKELYKALKKTRTEPVKTHSDPAYFIKREFHGKSQKFYQVKFDDILVREAIIDIFNAFNKSPRLSSVNYELSHENSLMNETTH